MTNMGCSLVVGADGQIGRALCSRLKNAIGTTRRSDSSMPRLDLSQEPATWQLPERIEVGYLCAAITSVEKCQTDPAGTRLINVERTLQLAHRLREQGAHFVFISTNQVFDGSTPCRPEDALPCPRTEYGRQKAEVERTLLDRDASIVRLTKVVTPEWKLIRDWVACLSRREPVSAFADMVMSPVPLDFAVEVLARVGELRSPGVFQVSGEVDVSYVAVAGRIADRLGISRELVQPISFADRKLSPDMAPKNTTLATGRVRTVLGLECPTVDSTLDDLIEGAISGWHSSVV